MNRPQRLGSLPPRGAPLPNRRMPSRPDGEPRPRAPTPKPSRGASFTGVALGLVLGAGGLAAVSWGGGCGNESPPPGPTTTAASGRTSSVRASGDPFAALPDPPQVPDDSNEPEVPEPDRPAAAAPKEWSGPWLAGLAHQTPIYPTARFSRNRLGYVRRGGKVPVEDKPLKTPACKQGFYPLVDGGYVCAKYATLAVDDPAVKDGGIKAPNVDALLPYRYAYNTKHGTPLYTQVPDPEAMLRYEPYLEKKKKEPGPTTEAKAPGDAPDEAMANADQPRADIAPSATPNGLASAELADAGASLPPALGSAFVDGGLDPASAELLDGGSEIEEKPWWQRDGEAPLNVTLAELEERDGVIAKRMVKGFFIAIDRTFGANNRMWYRSTGGLIAPSDRMVIPKTPELHGVAFDGAWKRVGFIRAGKAHKYELSETKAQRGDKLARFSAFGLNGESRLIDKQRYLQTVDGWWMREDEGTFTEPSERPSEVAAGEKWIDVNLTRKTLVAFEGERPVYASLVAPGKRSNDKKKDHRTKTGVFRVREKHVSTTMDGDGPSGDLPYSIEDVPYVQYYDGSFALHGAFWHENFGREQSHGCVNLAPADAKHLFQWSDPPLPRGWHGVWASDKRKGTWVVIHE